jgi:hypothetical protein
MARFTDAYIDRLLASRKFDALVELQGIFWGWSGLAAHHPQYGLPVPVFIFIESLNWFSQAIRSGVWSYFEVTPIERQEAMYAELQCLAPTGFAEQYRQGIKHWRDQAKMKNLDRWVSENESACDDWLFKLLLAHRQELRPLYA